MSDTKAPERARPCPICGQPGRPETRPFCSARCADIDLHRWFKGRYAIPAAEAPDPGEEPSAARDEKEQQ